MLSSAPDNRIVHLNHAGASPSPRRVIQTVVDHMELEQRLGGYAAAQQAQGQLDQVYESVARLLHASDRSEIALVESATVAWTRLFYSMVQYQDENKEVAQKKKVILVSEAEYAANIVAACKWARDHQDDWTVLAIPSATTGDGESISTGILDMNIFQDMLNGKHVICRNNNEELLDPSSIALVCITHVPTNSGIINPVEEVGRMIAQYNNNKGPNFPDVLYLVDACQSVGQMDVTVQDIQCHGLAGTGRKYLRGPRGTGFLYVHKDVAHQLKPHHIDHACSPVSQVPPKGYDSSCIENVLSMSYKNGAGRFEFWESNLANKLGFGQAIEIAMDQGLDSISQTCGSLAGGLQKRLRSMPGILIHHDNTRCGIVTFQVTGMDAAAVKEQLWCAASDDVKFEVSVVPATSTPLDSATCQVPDLVRASLSYTNTEQEIDAFCKRLKKIIPEHETTTERKIT